MSLRVHWLNTGEIEVSLATSLLGAGVNPHMPGGQVKPFGYKERIERSDGTVGAGTMVPIPIYYIEGTSRKMVVDTGTNLEVCRAAEELTLAYGAKQYWYHTADQDVRVQLERIGAKPEEIDTVILTHLHLDHIGNLKLFPNARFIVQREELAWFMAPPTASAFYYKELRPYVLDVLDQVECVEGDVRLESGVELISVGGHTPGSSVVLVATQKGKVAMVGDLLYNYVNLDLNWPPGAYWDLGQWLKAVNRVKREADIVVPNHDYYFKQLFPTGVIG